MASGCVVPLSLRARIYLGDGSWPVLKLHKRALTRMLKSCLIEVPIGLSKNTTERRPLIWQEDGNISLETDEDCIIFKQVQDPLLVL
jgi:hypothetical protein